ncbi:alpha/beta fold hydrolase [bacterium RCC_150]
MMDPIPYDVHFGGLTGRIHASNRSGGAVDGVPAFVLIHGIGVSHRYFGRLHELLAKSGDTYSVDFPGFGGTPKPARQLSVADNARFLIAALDQANVGCCILIGHSMGVQFAVEAFRQQPARFQRLVLMGPVVDPCRRSIIRQGFDLAVDCLFFESPTSNALVLGDYLKCGPRWYLKELPVMMSYRLEEHISDVSVPVLVLRGSRDPVASRGWCTMLARRVPAGEFREIRNCGHVLQHTGANRVAQAIRDFAEWSESPLQMPG